MSSKAKNIGIGIVVVLGVFIIAAGVTLAKPVERSYSFISVDHPVDMWKDGKDKWSYYSIGEGTKKDLAARVRKDLGSQGFVEDKSQKVWARFVRGNKEVVVCNHDEFAVNGGPFGGKPVLSPTLGKYKSGSQWPCVLVKNGPGTSEPIELFQVKKIVHGW